MRYAWFRVLLLGCLLIIPAEFGFAGNGKISGAVRGADGGVVPGANVVIIGTSLGAAGDPEGRYFILNVPPGTYSLRVSAVGFAPKVVTNVNVSSDQTVTLDLSLQLETVGLSEVVVEAERRLVDKSRTSTRTVVSSDELNNRLPILSVAELLNTTASVFQGRIRGSQRMETKTILDGVDVTDQFGTVANINQGDNGDANPAMRYNRVTKAQDAKNTVVDFNSSGLAEVDVIAGAANAEYVATTGGLYTASLREGRGSWAGRVFVRTGGGGFDRFMKGPGYFGPDFYPAADTALYFTNKRTLAASNNAKAGRYIYQPGQYSIGEKPIWNVEASAGGAVMDNLGLYFTGKWFDSPGWMPNELTRQASLSGKANYDLSGDMKLVFTGVLEDRGQIFGWKNRQYNDAYRFFLDGVPVSDGYSAVGSLKFTHFLNPSTFYDIQASFVKRSSRIGYTDSFLDSNGDGIPETYTPKGSADFLVLGYDTATVRKYIGAVGSGRFFNNNADDANGADNTIRTIDGLGVWLANPTYYYENLQTSATTFKGDFTSQITPNHQIRAGAQIRLHSIKQDRRTTVITPTDIDPSVGVLVEQYDMNPTEMGFYAQDKMEYSGLIVNLGARVDGFNPDASEFADFYLPYYNPVTGSLSVGPKSAFAPRRQADKIGTTWYFSPRLGVSHPITENATMYFSFSRTAQPVPFSQIYTAYNNINNTSLPGQFRTNQDPYKSTNYEFGASWEFFTGVSLNANAYFREIENYIRYSYALAGLRTQPVTTYNVYFNTGFAEARGIELTLSVGRQAVTDFLTLSGRVNYAASNIKGPSYPGINKTTFNRGTADSIYSQLPFDDAKNFKGYLTDIGGGGSVLGAGFDRAHRVGLTFVTEWPHQIFLTILGNYASGFQYANPTADNRTARQLETAPYNMTVDLRLEKAFTFTGIKVGVFMDVKNLLDRANILGYSTFTGTSQLKFYEKGDPTGEFNRTILPEGTSVYDMPRQVYIGAYVEF